MMLVLTNGYPYPYPENLTEVESERIANEALSHYLDLGGIKSVEWKHEFTVEFIDAEHLQLAQEKTGWESYGDLILAAPTSKADGYDHPAILTKGMAYCGFYVAAD